MCGYKNNRFLFNQKEQMLSHTSQRRLLSISTSRSPHQTIIETKRCQIPTAYAIHVNNIIRLVDNVQNCCPMHEPGKD